MWITSFLGGRLWPFEQVVQSSLVQPPSAVARCTPMPERAVRHFRFGVRPPFLVIARARGSRCRPALLSPSSPSFFAVALPSLPIFSSASLVASVGAAAPAWGERAEVDSWCSAAPMMTACGLAEEWARVRGVAMGSPW